MQILYEPVAVRHIDLPSVYRKPQFRDKPLEKESEKADMRSAESKYPDGTGPLFYQYMTAGAGHERKYDSKENRKYEDKMQ